MGEGDEARSHMTTLVPAARPHDARASSSVQKRVTARSLRALMGFRAAREPVAVSNRVVDCRASLGPPNSAVSSEAALRPIMVLTPHACSDVGGVAPRLDVGLRDRFAPR